MNRRIAHVPVLTLTAALAGTLLAVPFATPAQAAAGTEVAVYVADADADGTYGLYRRSTPSGTATRITGDTESLDVSDVGVSPDGTRVVDIETTYDSDGLLVRNRVAVRDIGGRLFRYVSDVPADANLSEYAPGFSPDGSSVVWSRVVVDDALTPTFSLHRAAVASGTPSTVRTGLTEAIYLDATTLLATTASGTAVTLPAAGGLTHAIQGTGIPMLASGFSLSPDGTKVAWSVDTTADGPETQDLQAAPFTVSGGIATFGGGQTLVTGTDNVSPSWARDGLSILFVKWDGAFGAGDLWTVPSAGGAAAALIETLGDELEVAVGEVDDGTAPGAATPLSAYLSGTKATVRWTAPADADLSGVLVTRRLGATAQRYRVYVPASSTTLLDTGLVVGQAYDYTFEAVDRSGHVGVPSTRHLIALNPVRFSLTDSTSARSTKAPFVVAFGGSNPTTARYTVRYRANGGAEHLWLNGYAARSSTFGSPASGTRIATTSVPGTTYSFRGTVSDGYGNSTGALSSTRTVVPFDQGAASLVGGGTVSGSDRWLGSVRIFSAAKNTARITVTGDRFQVIGERCPRCGAFQVYDGRTLVATVDSYARSRQVRRVLFSRSFAPGTHTFTVRNVGTRYRVNLILDGFAVRK